MPIPPFGSKPGGTSVQGTPVPPAAPTGRFRTIPEFMMGGALNPGGVGPQILGEEWAIPLFMPAAGTVKSLSIYILTGGSVGAVQRFGLRQSVNGLPSTLIADLGTVPSTSGGGPQTLTCSQALAAGEYFVTIACQVATSIPYGLAGANWSTGVVGVTLASIVGNNEEALCFYQTGSTGALPSTFTLAGTKISTTVVQVGF